MRLRFGEEVGLALKYNQARGPCSQQNRKYYLLQNVLGAIAH